MPGIRSEISASGTRVVADLRILDAATGAEIAQLPAEDWQSWSLARETDAAICWSKIGQILLVDLADGGIRSRFESRLKNRPQGCSLSPNSRIAAVWDWDGQIEFWEASAGRLATRWQEDVGGHSFDCHWSPDGRRLLTLYSGSATIWNLTPSRGPVRIAGPWRDSIGSVAFSTDGATVLARGFDSSGLALWSVDDDRLVVRLLERRLGGGYWHLMKAFSPNSKWLIGPATGSALSVLDPTSGERLGSLSGHAGAALCLDFDGEGKLAATGSSDGKIRFWNLADATRADEIDWHAGDVRVAAWSPQGNTLVTGGADGTVRRWSADGRSSRVLVPLDPTVKGSAGCLAVSPDGRWLVAGWHNLSDLAQFVSPGQGRLLLLDIEDGSCHATLAKAACSFEWCSFTPDGRYLLAASRDMKIRVWHVASLAASRAEALQPTHSLELWDGAAWNACTEQVDFMLYGSAPGLNHRFLEFALTPTCVTADSRRVVSAGGQPGVIAIHEIDGRATASTIEADSRWVRSWSIDPWSDRLITGGDGGYLRLWRLDALSLESECSTETAILHCQFAHSGKWILSVHADSKVRLWDESLSLRQSSADHESNCVYAAFSPNDCCFATLNGKGLLGIWSVPDCRLLAEYWTGVPAKQAIWKPDAASIAIGDSTGRVHVLELKIRLD